MIHDKENKGFSLSVLLIELKKKSSFKMLMMSWLFVLMTLTSIMSQEVPVGPYIQVILDIHNRYRRIQQSSNMQELVCKYN